MLGLCLDYAPDYARIMPIMLNFANYALCSDSAIMPKSNAGIIGLAQGAACRSMGPWAGVAIAVYKQHGGGQRARERRGGGGSGGRSRRGLGAQGAPVVGVREDDGVRQWR